MTALVFDARIPAARWNFRRVFFGADREKLHRRMLALNESATPSVGKRLMLALYFQGVELVFPYIEHG